MDKKLIAVMALTFSLSLVAHAAELREEMIPLGTDEGAPVTRPLSSGAGPRVELLGQLRLGNRLAASNAAISSCSRSGRRLTGLRFRILNSPARVQEILVQFGNNASHPYALNRAYLPNSDTGWLAFSRAGGLNPCVKKITITGQNANLTPDSAVVQIFGLSAPALMPREDAKQQRPSPKAGAARVATNQ